MVYTYELRLGCEIGGLWVVFGAERIRRPFYVVDSGAQRICSKIVGHVDRDVTADEP